MAIGSGARRVGSLFAMLVLVACASTQLATYIDPDYQGKEPVRSAMVFGVGMSLGERQIAENTLVEQLQIEGLTVLRGLDKVPPTRQHTDTEIASLIRKSGVETVVILTLGDQSTKSTFIPQSTTPSTSSSTINVIGNTAYVQTQTTPGVTFGGYSVEKPRAIYSAQLIDVESGRTIWRAEGKSRGNAFASFADLTESAAKEVVKQLKKDGFL